MRARRGFTLIEVLIAMVVITLLASIAVPQYTDYVTRSKLAEATSTLSDLRVRMEQYFNDNRSYVGAPVCAAPPAQRYFQYDCPTLTATQFTIRARGVAAEGMGGFTSYTINEQNARASTTASWGSSGNCWVIRKGGAC